MTDSQNALILLIDFSVVAVLIAGIWLFRAPRGARFGNLTAAFALLCAFVLVLYRHGVIDAGTVIISLLAGCIAGYAVARAVRMIQIPAMVAFQHGAGGIAAFLVSLVELMRGAHSLDLINEASGILGLTIGSLTFSGSVIAGAKLADKIRQTPQILPAHNLLVLTNLIGLLACGLAAFYVPGDAKVYLYVVQIALSALFGILFSIRIGGADMPVLISFLNATAGLAASFCGMVIENQLLIAFGATVAASGSILTHVMCKAMNRNLLNVFVPRIEKRVSAPKEMTDAGSGGPGQDAVTDSRQMDTDRHFAEAAGIVADARKIIIVPGYGMALAQAQLEVVTLAKNMAAMGKDVKYAVHPVAGRMPGHMNVLLAEAGVDYDELVEMDMVNPLFSETDVALVFGACDVVNPAAMNVQGTPISGMPILTAHEARNIVVCNYDKKPGYSGVENPLYDDRKTILLLGDAKETAGNLIASLGSLSDAVA